MKANFDFDSVNENFVQKARNKEQKNDLSHSVENLSFIPFKDLYVKEKFAKFGIVYIQDAVNCDPHTLGTILYEIWDDTNFKESDTEHFVTSFDFLKYFTQLDEFPDNMSAPLSNFPSVKEITFPPRYKRILPGDFETNNSLEVIRIPKTARYKYEVDEDGNTWDSLVNDCKNLKKIYVERGNPDYMNYVRSVQDSLNVAGDKIVVLVNDYQNDTIDDSAIMHENFVQKAKHREASSDLGSYAKDFTKIPFESKEVEKAFARLGISSIEDARNLTEQDLVDKKFSSILCRYNVTRFPEFKYFTNLTTLSIVKKKDEVYSVIPCTVKYIELPSSLTSIGSYAFLSSKVETLKIPPSVKTIGKQAFEFCDNLTTLVIPEGVETLQFSSIGWCNNLKVLYLPKSLKSVHLSFAEHNYLEKVYIAKGISLKLEKCIKTAVNNGYKGKSQPPKFIEYKPSLEENFLKKAKARETNDILSSDIEKLGMMSIDEFAEKTSEILQKIGYKPVNQGPQVFNHYEGVGELPNDPIRYHQFDISFTSVYEDGTISSSLGLTIEIMNTKISYAKYCPFIDHKDYFTIHANGCYSTAYQFIVLKYFPTLVDKEMSFYLEKKQKNWGDDLMYAVTINNLRHLEVFLKTLYDFGQAIQETHEKAFAKCATFKGKKADVKSKIQNYLEDLFTKLIKKNLSSRFYIEDSYYDYKENLANKAIVD